VFFAHFELGLGYGSVLCVFIDQIRPLTRSIARVIHKNK